MDQQQLENIVRKNDTPFQTPLTDKNLTEDGKVIQFLKRAGKKIENTPSSELAWKTALYLIPPNVIAYFLGKNHETVYSLIKETANYFKQAHF